MARSVSLLLTFFVLLISFVSSVPSSTKGIHDELQTDNLPTTIHNGIPVYGNWCGPGHFGGACVDSIDCACKAHDFCIAKYGTWNCRCDNELVQRLTGKKKRIAVAIRLYFRISPCRAPVSRPVVRFCKRCKKLSGKKRCGSVPCFKSKCKLTWIIARKHLITKHRC